LHDLHGIKPKVVARRDETFLLVRDNLSNCVIVRACEGASGISGQRSLHQLYPSRATGASYDFRRLRHDPNPIRCQRQMLMSNPTH